MTSPASNQESKQQFVRFGEKDFAINDEGRIDCTKYSLMDFSYGPEIDDMRLSDRIECFSSAMEDMFENRFYQYRRESESGSGPIMRVRDQYTGQSLEMVNLASNDYLNLTKHPRVIEGAEAALKKYGAGAGSVPLLGGTSDLHKKLERAIAKFKGCEDAILYTSGFGSNYGFLSTILRKKDVAILDMFAHASLVDGCVNTNRLFFMHNNMDSLESTLRKCRDKYVNKVVVVDGVYSMDGDIARLDRIVELAHRYGALVVVDEAHATGVIGATGRGTPQHFGLEGKVDIVAGTFSKGLGGVGGFIAGSRKLINYLHFFSRPYVFSTAMAPATVGGLLEALKVVEDEPENRAKLWENIHYFRSSLLGMGFELGNSETAIFPVILGKDNLVKALCRDLHLHSVYANPVLYPAVPKRLARVRFSLTSGLEKRHLDTALDALQSCSRKLGIL